MIKCSEMFDNTYARVMTPRPSRKGTMHYLLCFFFLLSLSLKSFANENLEKLHTLNSIPLKESVKKSALSGEVFSESKVKSFENARGEKEQSLNFTILGLHPKSCQFALKKLSRYENFHRYIDFVKHSEYDDELGHINFLLSHTLLPYNMRLIFRFPRITQTGVYPFLFEIGILKGLKGTVHVIDHHNRCLFYTNAHWTGPHTGFPNLIFEFFSQVLSKRSMEILFRISKQL